MLLYQRNYNSDVWEDRIVFLPNKIQEKKKKYAIQTCRKYHCTLETTLEY